MLHVFVDEPGDQGFNFEKGASRYFIIGFAFFPTTDYKNGVDAVKQQIAGYSGKVPKHLHFNKSSTKVRIELLKTMVGKGGRFGYIYEDKGHIYEYLRENPKINYNYNQMVYYLIENLIKKERVQDNMTIYISQRSSSKNIKKGLSRYLSSQANRLLVPYQLYPRFVKPYNSRGADCADFVCGSVRRLIEKKDQQYYDIIKNNIIIEKELFKR